MNDLLQSILLFHTNLMNQYDRLFEIGGPIIIVLLTLSIISLAIIILKFCQFFYNDLYRTVSIADSDLDLLNDNSEALIQNLSNSRHPAAVLSVVIIKEIGKHKPNSLSLREEILRIGTKEVNRLKAGLWMLELIAVISPLIGLLGTVLGMVDAFKALEIAGRQVDPSILSSGIWQALITTAAGLSVAIPSVFIFRWMESIIASTSEQMEDVAGQLLYRFNG